MLQWVRKPSHEGEQLWLLMYSSERQSAIDPYPGMDVDIARLSTAASRARILGKCALFGFGPPSAFLFVGTMIALAAGQRVAPRALIVFPILAIVVFGSGGSYLVCARYIRRGRRWAIIWCLCVASSVTLLALLDSWEPMVEGWMSIVRPVISLANLWLVGPLIRSLGPASRIELWLQGLPDTVPGWDQSDQRAM